jgi:hypothetical protein
MENSTKLHRCFWRLDTHRRNSPLQNNGSIFNVIYTRTDGRCDFALCSVQRCGRIEQLGIRIAPHHWRRPLANFAFNDFIKLAGRVEYIDSSGRARRWINRPSALRPWNNAFSFTITLSSELFYARAEWSIVDTGSAVPVSPLVEQEKHIANRFTSEARLF